MPTQPSDPATSQAPANLHSCVVCRQRKVKCDKQQRCSNCVKFGVECIYTVPARPRRRIGIGKPLEDVPKEELLRRLRRYEAIFRNHGLKAEDPGEGGIYGNNSKLETQPTAQNAGPLLDQVTGRPEEEEPSPRFTSHGYLWADLSGEILEDFFERDTSAASIFDSHEETPDSPNQPSPFDSGPETLTGFHPSPSQIFKLWQKFLDNVNPLTKIIHVPTVQSELLEASVDLENVSKPFEALMFAIYASAITSLSNEECEEITNVSRIQLQKRYFKAVQQALVRAGIFGTQDIVVLQAAVLLLTCSLPIFKPQEYWVLAGIVLRIGQSIGLHYKTYPTNLSVIESLMRRRLWWQIISLDGRAAQRCKVDVLVDSEYWNVPLPLNVNDSDLTSDMTVEPRGHLGATEMFFRLVMLEIGKFHRHSPAMTPFGGSWQKLSTPSVPLHIKDKVIDELEELLESKYLRYCDPVIPLHILTRTFARTVCCRMRLTIHHPRQFPDGGTAMDQQEKDVLFGICLRMIEQDNFLHSTDCIRGFIWLFGQGFQVDAFVYLLSELRYRNRDPTSEKAWSEISKAFEYHPKIIFDTKSALNVAIGNLTLKSWESWESRSQDFHRHHPDSQQVSQPQFISQLLQQRTRNTTISSTEPSMAAASMDLDTNPPNSQETSIGVDWDFDPVSMVDPLAPIDWNYWNHLMQDAETINNFAPQTNDWSIFER